ncbi:MAG: tetratricopeptide repeat protein [Neisseria sp.]|nr:tetratricopeptide repeat protein [Neisseria sp.]
MALDLQEQEELENAKRAWKTWGRWVFAVLLVCALVYFGNILWKNHIAAQNEQAVDLMASDFTPKALSGDTAGALKALQTLQQKYPKTVATAQATLNTAGNAFLQGKYDEAAQHLQWLAAHQKDPAVHALVLRQLATVYLQQKKYDEALAVLSEKVEPEFSARAEELKGDIYLAQGKQAEARAAFQAALQQLPENDQTREFIEAKSKL